MMRGQYLTEDREFVLDQLRLLAFAQSIYGVATMPQDAFSLTYRQNQNRGGVWECTLRLLECRALTPNGYPVEIVRNAGAELCAPYTDDLAPQHSATGSKIPIYLGIRQDMEPVGEKAGQGRSLRRFAQARYLLSTTRNEQGVEDWLCIGQLINDTSGVREDTAFIPECLRLDSMPRLKDAAQQVQKRAGECLTHLQKQLLSRKAEAGILLAILMEASVVLDWGERPRAYLNRLYRILMQLNELRFLLPYPAQQKQIEAHLATAIAKIPPETDKQQEPGKQEADWGYLLLLVVEALQNLAEDYKNWEADIKPEEGEIKINRDKTMQQSPTAHQQDSDPNKRGLFNRFNKSTGK